MPNQSAIIRKQNKNRRKAKKCLTEKENRSIVNIRNETTNRRNAERRKCNEKENSYK